MFRFRTYILLIIFIGLMLYLKGLQNSFVGDDDLQIVRNTQVHSITHFFSFFTGSTYENGGSDTIAGIFYRPIMMTVFSLIYTFAGAQPLAFHLVQLLFHISNTVLVFLFLRRLMKEKYAFIGALFFLINPVNSETILYSANLQEVLFFFFGMLALLFSDKQNKSYLNVALVSIFIFLSLLSKESGALFIPIILLYSLFFHKQRAYFRRLLVGIILTAFVYCIFRYGLAHMFKANSSIAPITNASFSIRLENVPAIIFYYLKLLVFPVDLSVDQFWIVTTTSLRSFWIPLVVDVLFGIVLFTGYIWIHRKGSEKVQKYVFFLAWFTLGLFLHVQILPLDATVADRWFYFPFVGIVALIVTIIEQVKFHRYKYTNMIAVGLTCLALVSLAMQTFFRISDWKNELTLYSHDTKIQRNFILDNAYGSALINNNQYAKAKKFILSSVTVHPYAANLNNLAIIYTAEGNKIKAKEVFEDALKSSQNFSVYENYANFLLYYEEPGSALSFSKKALTLFPESPQLWLVRAQSAYLAGKKDEALRSAAWSYKLEPDAKTLSVFMKIKRNQKLILKA